MAFNPRTLTLAVAGVAATFTLLVTVLPFVQFAYESPEVHLALETATGLIGLLVAYLMYGRFRRSQALPDLVLAAGLLVLAARNLFFGVGPALSDDGAASFATWAPLFGALIGSVGIAAAALLQPRPVGRPARAALLALGGSLAALLSVALFVGLLGHSLPRAIDPSLSPEVSDRPRIVGEPAVLAIQLIAAGLYAIASAGFVRRAERGSDELMAWFAIGSVLEAFARLNYFLFPSVYSDWVYTGDALRLAFYGVLMVGAGREIGRYQRELSDLSALEERRRVARELHDGLAQELAFINSSSRRLASREPALEQIRAASERALDEARSAIAALTSPVDESLDAALARAAEEVAGRHGASVRLDLEEGVEVEPATREALARIVRESVTNAIRHGHADSVEVRLRNAAGVRLEIEDDGSGFDPEAAEAGHGFGLVSMRERAAALGGELVIRSAGGRGTTVLVVIP